MPAFPLSAMPVPLVYASHRIIRDCNDAFAAVFGYEREELIDTSFSRLYPGIADFVRTGQMWRGNLGSGAIYHDERVMRRRDGTAFWCRVRGRSRQADDPFAEAIYCFEPLARPVRVAKDHMLTDRQRQIVALVAQGKTNRAIAAEIGLSQRTVEAHRARLMRQIGVANAAGLIAWFSGVSERE